MIDTLVSRVQSNARGDRRNAAFVYLGDGEQETERWTLEQIDLRARSIAQRLTELDAPGHRAILLYAPGLEFIGAFLGCLYASVIAVPVFPPSFRRRSDGVDTLEKLAADCGASFVLTDSVLAGAKEVIDTPHLSGCHWLCTQEVDGSFGLRWSGSEVGPDDVAFIQYTSGSKSDPKGVVVSHRNLSSNFAAIVPAMHVRPTTRAVSWLPMYHDMGLIGMVLTSLYVGNDIALLSPLHFLQRPMRWLEAVSKYRATISGAPNFAWELCLRRSTPEQRAELNLSSWEVAFTGAEVVRGDTLKAFAEAFSCSGLGERAFYPCYGLAEATLFVTGSQLQGGAHSALIDRKALEQGRIEPDPRGSCEIVGCGYPREHTSVRIVDPETRELCRDGVVGEIWVSGGGVAQGYWNRQELSAATFRGRLASDDGREYLRTGDLGALDSGRLMVTGRLKDMIIIRGANVYPQDVERTVESTNGALRVGCCAAFAVEADGEEQLVVVQEARSWGGRWATLLSEIVARLSETMGVQAGAVVLVAPGQVPKTSSGKVRRGATRAAYVDDQLEEIARWERGKAVSVSPKWQREDLVQEQRR